MEKENLDNGIKPDVNESLALAGLLRRVSVESRLPEDSKGHYYILKDGRFAEQPKFSIHKEQKKIIRRTCKYWLEEVELPTDEKIENALPKSPIYSDKDLGFIEGAKWMRSLAVTAKDNVR